LATAGRAAGPKRLVTLMNSTVPSAVEAGIQDLRR
jgi:hypothetical protein